MALLLGISCILPFSFNSTQAVDISVRNNNKLPPPELVIQEGEEWIPDAVDPFSIVPYGSDDECRHGGAVPSGYRYIGAVCGNTNADVIWVDLFSLGVSSKIPNKISLIISIAGIIADAITVGDKLQGPYIKWQYIYDEGGLDPNMYWYHTVYQFATVNGYPVGDACYATYSPQKPGDPLQD